jgi:hypothetical protein
MDERTGRIVRRGPWDIPYKAERVLCGDGVRRTVRVREPDTYFSLPGTVKVRGKSVSGFVSFSKYVDEERGDEVSVLTFTPYKYGKNADVLPNVPQDFSIVRL